MSHPQDSAGPSAIVERDSPNTGGAAACLRTERAQTQLRAEESYRTQAEAALERRVAQQSALAALSQAALAKTSIEALMQQVVHCVADTLGTEFAKVLELAPGGRHLLLRAGVGWTEGLVGRATVGTGRDSQAGFTLLADRPVIVTDLRTETRFTGPTLLNDHGVVSGMSCAIRGLDGSPYGVLGAHTRSLWKFSNDDVNFLRSVANVLAAAIGRLRAEEARREAELRLAAEVDALARLNTLSSRLWKMPGLSQGLEEILDATVALLGADMGNVQLLDGGVLLDVAQHGFHRHFREVTVDDDSACARVLRSGRAVVIDDVEADERYAALRPAAREAGYRAVLSTPLVGRHGDTLGVASAYFRSRHLPSDQDLQRLTLYIREAADFIERWRAEAALRENEARLLSLLDALPVGVAIADADGKLIIANREMDRYLPTRVIPSRDDTRTWRWRGTQPDGGAIECADYPSARALRGERVVPGLEFRYTQDDGTEVWTQVAAVPLPPTEGRVAEQVIVISDITAVKRADEALRQRAREQEKRAAAKSLMYEMAQILNEATTWDDAVRRVLRRLCEAERWKIGYVYLPQPGRPETIEPVVSCFVDERLRPFDDFSMQQTYARGEQMPGRVYAENAVSWAEDREALFAALPMRAARATAVGLRAAVSVPVAIRGEVVAVLELFSDQVHPADDDLAALVQNVGDQIGRILEREQATARMAEVVWREQQELLHALHDSLGQTLTGLGMLSTGLRRRLPAHSEVGETAAEIAHQAQQALDQVRQLAKKVFPVEVDAESLMAALRDLASATESLHKIHVRLQGHPPAALHDGKIATELYRIAQEAVTNSVKHGRAKTIRIGLEGIGELTQLTIADDGIGISQAVLGDGAGLGIMRYRASSIGASLRVERGTRGGTIVTCTIRQSPMSSKKHA